MYRCHTAFTLKYFLHLVEQMSCLKVNINDSCQILKQKIFFKKKYILDENQLIEAAQKIVTMCQS